MAIREVKVPHLGDFDEVPVVEVLVGPGDEVRAEEALITLESDKATMDVPAPCDGVVRAVSASVGDSVSEGVVLLTIEGADAEPEATTEAPGREASEAPAPREPSPAAPRSATHAPPPQAAPASARTPATAPAPTTRALGTGGTLTRAHSHATPSLRRFARTLGVDLSEISGTGRKGRILEEDVRAFVKERLEGAAGGEPAPVVPAEAPAVDFSRYGEIEVRALSRIKRLSGPHLHRAWSEVPHVTHHDEADVTALEAFRQSLKREASGAGVRITFLTFALKALARAVREFPDFNASLSPDGRSLVLKQYVNIGVAVDTPNGLVVPVVRAVETKGIFGLARELGDLGARARENRLRPADLEGGSITVSSLGGIGGIAFTPIVNAPEVAILGLARSRIAPMWDGSAFQPRLMQPLDLSYDHRVIDGAQAARFVRRLSELLLEDPQRLLL